jgi:hypothetical protein
LFGDGVAIQFNHPDKDSGGLGGWGIIDDSAAFDGALREDEASEAEDACEGWQPQRIS